MDFGVRRAVSVVAPVDGTAFGKEKRSIGLGETQGSRFEASLGGKRKLEMAAPSNVARTRGIVDTRDDARIAQQQEQALEPRLLVPVDLHVPGNPSHTARR